MAKESAMTSIPAEFIERRIHVVCGQRVMLDEDLAALYSVATKVLNQAVQRNRDRFPNDFAFQLTAQEFANLKSQTVTSSSGHGGRRKLPWAFTEHGVAMLTGVLRSPAAIEANLAMIRAFVRIRRLLAPPGELVSQLQQLAETVKQHDDRINILHNVLAKMLKPEPEVTPKRRIGFQSPEPPPPAALSRKGKPS